MKKNSYAITRQLSCGGLLVFELAVGFSLLATGPSDQCAVSVADACCGICFWACSSERGLTAP